MSDQHSSTTPQTLQELAKEAAGWFETATRSDEAQASYVRTRDGRPEWLQELVYDAHGQGDMLPDDWRYACIEAALDYIADDGNDDLDDADHDFADGYADVYTAARLAWLASHLSRAGYVDQAREEGLIEPDAGITDAIGVGQYMEAREVFESVLTSLRDELEAREPVDEDEEA